MSYLLFGAADTLGRLLRICLAIILAALGALLAPAGVTAAAITYDCHARSARTAAVPEPPASDPAPWQCRTPWSSAHAATAVLWQRKSLEYCRLTVTAYATALRAAQAYAKAPHHSWIVIMDADETILDNSLFEREQQACNLNVTDARWRKWERAGLAEAVPGAVAFVQAVRSMGGLVAIVTNRHADNDGYTRANLHRLGLEFDFEIGQGARDPSNKASRWNDAVKTLAQHYPGARPVMWIGDQVTDLAIRNPDGSIQRPMSQSDAGDGIGDYLFLIPNPMYGNWQANPDN
ncbi:MAG TPA: HAD family acid phosphatase [Rhizomicrobium sp.]